MVFWGMTLVTDKEEEAAQRTPDATALAPSTVCRCTRHHRLHHGTVVGAPRFSRESNRNATFDGRFAYPVVSRMEDGSIPGLSRRRLAHHPHDAT